MSSEAVEPVCDFEEDELCDAATYYKQQRDELIRVLPNPRRETRLSRGMQVNVGDTFGLRTITEVLPADGKKRRVTVRCVCGNVDDVCLADLVARRCDGCRECRSARARAATHRPAGPVTVRCPQCSHCFNVKGNS